MPNKTIYVSDDDLPLFTRAQEIVGGNLSGAIVAALRSFLDRHERIQEGFEEIVVRVGPDGVDRRRFLGRLLAGETEWADDGTMVHRDVYAGPSGRFLLHTQTCDWNDYRPAPRTGNWLKDLTGLTSLRSTLGINPPDWGDFAVEVADDLDGFGEALPRSLRRRAAGAAGAGTIEDIDL